MSRWRRDVSLRKKEKYTHLKMDSLGYQMEALKTPLVLFIVVALGAAVAYLYMNRKKEGAAVPIAVKEVANGTLGVDQGGVVSPQTTIQSDTAAAVSNPGTAYTVHPVHPGQRVKLGTGTNQPLVSK